MPYDWGFFKRNGIYHERVEQELEFSPENGQNVIDLLSPKVRDLLRRESDSSHGGDYSRQDSAIITAMLRDGYEPEDVFATFAASTRGRHAKQRKEGHFEDYLNRTIRKAASYLLNNNGKKESSHIKVDFGRDRLEFEEDGIVGIKMTQYEMERTQWLWEKYIPAGKITILAGDPGMAKSTISLDIVSRLTRGTFMPCGERSFSGSCVIASAEDAPQDTIAPRLLVAQANMEKVTMVHQVNINGEANYLSFPRDLVRLKEFIVKTGARLMIVDPLNAFIEKGTDTYKDQDIRLVLAPLEYLAEETGAAILIIAHLNKKEDSSVLYRVGGSIGFIGAARSVLAVSHLPNRKGMKVLYSLKSNLSMPPPALMYETRQIKIKKKHPKQWLGEDEIVSSGIRWHGEIAFDPSKGAAAATDQAKADTEAEDFIRQVLDDGAEVESETIYREAKMAGISRPQVNHVKTQIGIRSKKKKDGKWYWSWPKEDVL